MGEDQVNESVKDGGLRFIRVEAADRESIDIDLSNGTFVMLRPKLILELPGFAELAEDDRIFIPKRAAIPSTGRPRPRPIGIGEFLALIGKTDDENKQT